MSKRKRKLTPAEKAAKKKRRLEYETIFVNGKQKRVKRQQPLTPDGIEDCCDPIFMMQNEMYEELHVYQMREDLMDAGIEEAYDLRFEDVERIAELWEAHCAGRSLYGDAEPNRDRRDPPMPDIFMPDGLGDIPF